MPLCTLVELWGDSLSRESTTESQIACKRNLTYKIWPATINYRKWKIQLISDNYQLSSIIFQIQFFGLFSSLSVSKRLAGTLSIAFTRQSWSNWSIALQWLQLFQCKTFTFWLGVCILSVCRLDKDQTDTISTLHFRSWLDFEYFELRSLCELQALYNVHCCPPRSVDAHWC